MYERKLPCLLLCVFTACTTMPSAPAEKETRGEEVASVWDLTAEQLGLECPATDDDFSIPTNEHIADTSSVDLDPSPHVGGDVGQNWGSVDEDVGNAGDLLSGVSADSKHVNVEDGAETITWDDLEGAIFEYKDDSLIASFPKSAETLHGKEIQIGGYVIPLGPGEHGRETVGEHNFALSSNIYSSCFFCGAAGPDTVVSFYSAKRYDTDQVVTLKGTLLLNPGPGGGRMDEQYFLYRFNSAIEVD